MRDGDSKFAELVREVETLKARQERTEEEVFTLTAARAVTMA